MYSVRSFHKKVFDELLTTSHHQLPLAIYIWSSICADHMSQVLLLQKAMTTSGKHFKSVLTDCTTIWVSLIKVLLSMAMKIALDEEEEKRNWPRIHPTVVN